MHVGYYEWKINNMLPYRALSKILFKKTPNFY